MDAVDVASLGGGRLAGVKVQIGVPGEHAEEPGAHGIDVDAGVVAHALGLLRRHVGQRAGDKASRRVPAPGEGLLGHMSDAKVGDLGGAIGGKEDVGRFEVAMDDTLLVGRIQALAHVAGDAEYVRLRQGALALETIFE